MTDSLGTTQSVVTDISGDFSAAVTSGTVVSTIDETTLPPGSKRTAGDNPTTGTVTGGANTPLAPVGYQFLSQAEGTVSGHIYNDVNGNGVQDPAEPDLQGVSVIISDSQGSTHTVVADANGDYQTTVPVGTTRIDVDDSTLPPGSVLTGGSDPQTVSVAGGVNTPTAPDGYQQRGGITGHLFNDVNGNGVQDSGEPNLPGVTVVVTDCLGATHSLTTDASGDYAATIPVGSATSKVDESSLPPGSVLTTANDPQTVTVLGGVSVATTPVGYQVQGTLSGHVFNDVNGNGVQDPGEPNLSGVTVKVTDSLGAVRATATDSNGDWQTTAPVGGATAKVDASTLPAGSALTTANDPQDATVTGGASKATAPVGYQQRGTITGHVFGDTNGNAVQDPGEPDLTTVTVVVTDSQGTTQPVNTDSNGNWSLLVPVGETTANVDENSLQPGSVLTTGNDPQTVTVSGGASAPTTPVGYQQQGIVSGHVFNDVNENGVQDPGEPDLPNITVVVTDCLGTTRSVVTDSSGDYSTTVPAGVTGVDIDDTTLPPGSERTAGSDPATVNVPGGGEGAVPPVGYQAQGMVRGRVFDDINGNGVQDPGEPGLANVSVRIVEFYGDVQIIPTDANGDYTAAVPVGTNSVSVVTTTLPPGSVLTTANETQSFVVVGAQETATDPVGYQQRGGVSGHVFNDVNENGVQDPGEPDLPNIAVVVTDSLGTTHTVATDARGDYVTSVPVGTTTVKIDETTLPPGSVRTAGSDPATVAVPGGGDAATAPVGYQARGTVTGHVFDDANGNGVQDPGEPDLPNVSVNITEPYGEVQTVVTDTSGNYSAAVPVGTNNATVVTSTVPAGSVVTTANESQDFTITGGATTATTPVGYQQVGTVSGHVFNDRNGNGAQDPGEPNLPGVGVVVTDSNGTTRTVSTDASGDYSTTVPAGQTEVNIDETTLPPGSVLTAGQDPVTITVEGDGAGAVVPPVGYQQRGRVTGHLFNDVNGNGVQDPGEPDLPNVSLLISEQYDGAKSVVTDAKGDYSAELAAGDDTVSVVANTLPPGMVLTTSNDPQSFTIAGAQTTDTTPVGYQALGSVTGHVFNDVNGNGVQDPGEPNLPGVTVIVTDSQGTTQSLVTDASGDYGTTVPAGATFADIDDTTLPPGSRQTAGSDPETVEVTGGSSSGLPPQGYQQVGTVTGHVFNDVNGNGVQDAGEPDLPGVMVYVTDSLSRVVPVLTDASGDYSTTVPVGSVTTKVNNATLPSGSVLTTANDPQTVTVSGGAATPTTPVGYQQRGTVTGHIFNDVNGNGVQDPGEPDLYNVVVLVTDSQGTTRTVATDPSGNYATVVPIGETQTEVDESSLQPGSHLTTANDPQSVAVAGGVNNPTSDVGFQFRGTVTGHVWNDLNGNGIQDVGEPDYKGAVVVVADSLSTTRSLTTNGSGDWSIELPEGVATADLVASSLPAGSLLTTANAHQSLTVVAGSSVASTPMGFVSAGFAKSNGVIVGDRGTSGQLDVGDTVKFDIVIANPSLVSPLVVNLLDPLPLGLTNLEILSQVAGDVTSSTVDRLVVRELSLAPGETTTITITAVVCTSAVDGQPLVNTASLDVGADGSDDLQSSGSTAVVHNSVDPARIPDFCTETTTISTEAGTGGNGWTGDGGPASKARVWNPYQVCVDSDNNLFIADYSNHVVRKITKATGVISTVAGMGNQAGYSGDGGPATSARLRFPADVFVRGTSLYIAEMGNSVIRKVDLATGLISTVAGTGTAGYNGDAIAATSARLNSPRSVVVDVAGNVIIADTFSFRIRKVDASTGLISTIAGTGTDGHGADGGLATSEPLEWVMDMAISPACSATEGQLFFSEQNGYNIVRYIDSQGRFQTLTGRQGQDNTGDCGPAALADFHKPYGIAFDTLGNFYIADRGNQKIRKIDALKQYITTIAGTGTAGYNGDGIPAKEANLNTPTGIAVGSDGVMHIADTTNNRVRSMNLGVLIQPPVDPFPNIPSGLLGTIAGDGTIGYNGDGRDPRTAWVSYPASMAVDAYGNVIVADRSNHRVRRIYTNWTMETLAGTGVSGYTGDGGQASFARLSFPTSVAIAPDATLYISDQGNHVVRRVAPNGTITTVAGTGSAGNGPTGPATSCALNSPEGLAVVGRDLYIADRENNFLRRLNLDTGLIVNVVGNGANGAGAENVGALLTPLSLPRGIAWDAAHGRILIAASSASQVRQYFPGTELVSSAAGTGVFGDTGDGGPATAAQLMQPYDVAARPDGSFYICDRQASVIRRVDQSGTISRVAGTGTAGYYGDKGYPLGTMLNSPDGIAVNAAGDLFIADRKNQRIRCVAH